MTEERTKWSLPKSLNGKVNVLCAKLGLRKTEFLDKLTKVPVGELRKLMNLPDEE